MPSPTFFNLPQAKQQRLMDAIWQEFTTVSYMDASINKIIQAAEISRGSFYQYFSGKQDVFAYLLQTFLESGRSMFQAQLTVHGSNLFDAILGMYDLIVWHKQRSKKPPELERLQLLLQLNAELDMSQFTELIDKDVMTANAMVLMAEAGYPMESVQQCRALIHMLISIGISNTVCHLKHNTQEDSRQLLQLQLDIIRQGLTALRKEEPATC